MKPSGIIGIILICAVISALCSSCGLIVINNPFEEETTAAEASTEATETEGADNYTEIERDYSAEARARLDSIESINYDGAVVKIASMMPHLTDAENAPEIVSSAVAERNRLVEEKFGITLVTASVDNATLFQELSASAKSGMYYADMICVPQNALVSYITSGLLFNMRSMPKTELDADYFNQSAVESASAGYGNYAVAGEATYTPYSLPAVYFSVDRLTELGLELPYEKVKAGEWTWDEFYTYLTDIDGEIYTPFCTGDAGDFAIDYSFFSVGGRFMNAGDMRYPTVRITEEDADMITAIAGAFTDERNLVGDAGGISAFEESCVFMIDTLDSLYTMANSPVTWGIVPMPKMSAEQETYISAASPDSMFFAVPSVLNSDERTALVLRSIFAASYGSVKDSFIRYTQNSMLRDNTSTNMLEYIMYDIRYDFAFTVQSMYEEVAVATSYVVRNAVYGTAELGPALHNSVWRCESALQAAFPMS